MAGVAVAVLIALNWFPALDKAAERYLSEAITDNLVIYATARSINGIISVIQSVELSVSLGAGVGVHLGEILDPLNDLIERFSGFVLYGLAGLGLQKMVLVATSGIVMKVLTTLALIAAFVWWLWRQHRPVASREDVLGGWLLRSVLLLLLVRFAFVIEVGVIRLMDAAYFDARTQEAHSALQLAQSTLSGLQQQYMDAASERGFYSGIWEAAANVLGDEGQQGITGLTASAVVELIVITFVRGLLLPLIFIWALVVIAGRLVWPAGDSRYAGPGATF